MNRCPHCGHTEEGGFTLGGNPKKSFSAVTFVDPIVYNTRHTDEQEKFVAEFYRKNGEWPTQEQVDEIKGGILLKPGTVSFL